MPEKQITNSRERGQSMVEFAFAAVILIVLLVGIADMARLMYTYMALREAAEEGALVASLYPDDEDLVRNRVRENSNLAHGLEIPDSGIDIEYDSAGFPGADPCNGWLVRVTVEYTEFELTTPFIGALITSDNQVTISAGVSATVLRPDCQ